MRVTGTNSLWMTSATVMTNEEEIQNAKKIKDALTKKTGTNYGESISSADKKRYQELQSLVEELSAKADLLTDESSTSVFSKAEESKDHKEAIEHIQDFIGQYNRLLKSLGRLDTDSAQGYSEELKDIAARNKEKLEKAGVTIGEDGTLSIHKESMEKASLEDLKDLFGPEGSFTKAVADEGIYIGASATVYASMPTYGATGVYGATGQDISQLMSLVGGYLDSLG